MKTPNNLKREDTRERILAKADALFRQYGCGKTTVGEIADELGMSPANIYKFFPSKSAIMEASAVRWLGQIKSRIAGIVGGAGGAMARIGAVVLSVYRFHQALLRNEHQIFKLVTMAVEEKWSCVQAYKEFLMETMTGLVEQGIKSGEFEESDPRETARALLDCLSLALHPHLRADFSPEESEDRVNAQIRLLAKALRKN